ncbi:MAG: hypothetical protein M3Z28_01470 [Candidatus Dormibacteraeota bacterium]|nr:hypothetical protein [Candidatus Dormibacteraeota bacterium]
MRAQRCRLPARLVLAAILAGMALAAASVGALAAGNGVTLTVHVGYQDVVKPGEWMPVTIDAKNTGAGIDGTLELQEVLNGQPGVTGLPIYQQTISLASGASKRIRGYVVEDTTGATIVARIVMNGRVVVSRDSAAAGTTSTMIGVLSDQATSLDGFAAVHPGSVAARVVHLRADELAESAIPLRAFDILAIDDFATDGLTAGQRTAISDYIRGGGDLLLGTGAAWRKTLAGLSPAILPMSVTGTTTVTTDLLGGSPVEVVTGTATPGPVWMVTGGHPLLLERTVGGGTVTMAAFDWNQEPIAGWSGSAPLLRQLIARAVFGTGGGNQNFAYAMGGPGFAGFGSQPSISSRSNALTSVLGNLPSLDLPSFQLTGALVLLYVLLVGPVNYFVLGAMRRRALTWVTVPLIAVIAAGGAYGTGVLTKGRSVQVNQIAILHLQPGSDRAYQETYTGIIAPSRGDYQATVGGERLLISPIVNNGAFDGSVFGTGSRSGSIRINVDNNNLTLPRMTAFVLGGFATEAISPAPQLTAHLQLVNGSFTGTVENHSGIAFTDAVLIVGDSFQTFGPLKPGAAASINLTPKPANPFGQPLYTRIYGSSFFNGPGPSQPTAAQREDYAKTQILAVLPTGGSFKGISLASSPLLVGWTHQPLQAVTVNGANPRSTAESAVALSLPIDHIGTGSLPSGLVTGRIVDVVGDNQGGPPGILAMQNGSVTYEFAPPLATGTRLTSATLNSSNQYGGKFMGPPSSTGNGSDQSMQSEVWDWSHGAWTTVAFQNSGSTALPDGAVNSDTGMVRFRLSGNSGFMAGAITLSGTIE